MIDESKMARLNGVGSKTAEVKPPTDLKEWLSGLSHKELRKIQRTISGLLPDVDVKGLDLEKELVSQYQAIKQLFDDVIDDPDVAPNQKAQVANSVGATLSTLSKSQEDLRLTQVLRLIESVLIEEIKTLPKETKDAFFERYEFRAKKEGLM